MFLAGFLRSIFRGNTRIGIEDNSEVGPRRLATHESDTSDSESEEMKSDDSIDDEEKGYGMNRDLNVSVDDNANRLLNVISNRYNAINAENLNDIKESANLYVKSLFPTRFANTLLPNGSDPDNIDAQVQVTTIETLRMALGATSYNMSSSIASLLGAVLLTGFCEGDHMVEIRQRNVNSNIGERIVNLHRDMQRVIRYVATPLMLGLFARDDESVSNVASTMLITSLSIYTLFMSSARKYPEISISDLEDKITNLELQRDKVVDLLTSKLEKSKVFFGFKEQGYKNNIDNLHKSLQKAEDQTEVLVERISDKTLKSKAFSGLREQFHRDKVQVLNDRLEKAEDQIESIIDNTSEKMIKSKAFYGLKDQVFRKRSDDLNKAKETILSLTKERDEAIESKSKIEEECNKWKKLVTERNDFDNNNQQTL